MAGGDFLEHTYAVTLYGKQTGSVSVRKQGLYYHFSCTCALTGGIIYRLMASCGTVRENLGILVPKEESFILDTKLPAKKLGEGELSFYLVPKREEPSGIFIPIYPEEPFAYISRLKNSFLVMQNKQAGICIKQMLEH